MTSGAPEPETISVICAREPRVGSGAGSGAGADDVIEVRGASITLRPPIARDSGHRSVTWQTDLIWLTRAELALIEQRPIDRSTGLGEAIASLLASIPHTEASAASPRTRRQLGLLLRGLLSAVAAERLESGRVDSPAAEQLVVRALQVVNARLDDPQLSTAAIAVQLGVSLRSLQAAFRAEGTALASRIWALRLERARLEVGQTELLTRAEVAAVGAQWGFRGTAHFSRSYERRYGVRPA